jgi:hypothetical protein
MVATESSGGEFRLAGCVDCVWAASDDVMRMTKTGAPTLEKQLDFKLEVPMR